MGFRSGFLPLQYSPGYDPIGEASKFMDLKDMARKRNEDLRIREIASQSVNPQTGMIDENLLIRNLTPEFPSKARKIQELMDKQRIAREAAQWETQKDIAEIGRKERETQVKEREAGIKEEGFGITKSDRLTELKAREYFAKTPEIQSLIEGAGRDENAFNKMVAEIYQSPYGGTKTAKGLIESVRGKKQPLVRVDTGTKGQTAFDKAFAKEAAEFTFGGGFATLEKNVKQLEDAASALKSGKNISGPIIGLLPEWTLKVFNPEAADIQETVAEVTQQNLRAILGGQFAMREGEQLVNRAYNPSLDETVNAKRVGRLIEQIQKIGKIKMAMIAHFDDKGTLEGFDKTGFIETLSEMGVENPKQYENILEESITGKKSPKSPTEWTVTPSGYKVRIKK